MTRQPTSLPLTEEQKRQICVILSAGCARETAAKAMGCSLVDIHQQMLRDQSFSAELRRAEAAAELSHMRNVKKCADDERHWRASVWWLERSAPDRYARRDANSISARQLESIVNQLVAVVTEEVHHADDWKRLLARLQCIVDSLQELSRDGGVVPDVVDRGERSRSPLVESQDVFDADDRSPPDDGGTCQ